MRILVLYILTLLTFLSIHILHITYVYDRVFPEQKDKDDLDEFKAEPGEMNEMLEYLLYLLLYTLAFILFAILPALSQGGVLTACRLSFLMAAVIACGSNLLNFKYAQHAGLKYTLYGLATNIFIALMVTPVSYFIAWLLVR